MKKIYPLVISKELAQTADFYVKYFGFEKVFAQDWYIHLVHESGAELAFMAPNVDTQPKELHAAFSGKGMVYSFEVDDAAAEYARLTKAGAPIILELKTEPWGQTHFILKDPSGVYVDVVQQLETE